MPYYTQEHTSTSKRGWKQPLRSQRRTYPTIGDVKNRISRLTREYGSDNVVHMPKKGDPSTEVVYVRLY